MLLELTDDNFTEETSTGFVLVDFWAPWCAPCRIVDPAVEELARSFGDQVKFAKLNVDEHHMAALKSRVLGVPTVILFRDGRPLDVIYGSHPRSTYQARLERHLSGADL